MLKIQTTFMTLIFAVSMTIVVQPSAEAGFWSNARDRVKKSFQDGKTNIRINYTPPKSIISGGCDPQGRAYGSIAPKLRTPVGTFGVTASRKFSSARCWKS
jgi:hypothetical protein